PNRKQTTITKAFEISLAKLHNTTEQAIHDKAITEIHDGLYQAEEKLKVLSMRDLIKLAPTECLEMVQESIQKQQKSNQEKSERDAIENRKRLKSIMITEDEWTAVAGIINILKLFSDITNYISGSSYSTMSIIYPTISTLRNALLKEYVDEDISIYDTNEIDLDTDDISVFDLEEVSDVDEEFEQIRSLAAITNLVERIKNIMSELFE
ncbi:5619_t:CDS:2, partial [Gigaspora margarita]